MTKETWITPHGPMTIEVAIPQDVLDLLLTHLICAQDSYDYSILGESDLMYKSAELLLSLGANPNKADDDGEFGAYPLERAAMHENISIVKLLLEHGADPLAITTECDETIIEKVRRGCSFDEKCLSDKEKKVKTTILKLLQDAVKKVKDKGTDE